jgi:hypothetical protein
MATKMTIAASGVASFRATMTFSLVRIFRFWSAAILAWISTERN